MTALPPAYLAALAAQIATLSAFLGGFSATYLATLLSLSNRSRPAGVAIGFAVVASVSFIVSTVGATMLVAAFHPEAPEPLRQTMPIMLARSLATLCFGLGLYAVLTSLAVSGWARSRRTGWVTSVAGAIGAVLVTLLVVQVA